MGGSVAMGPHRTVASVLAVLACFLFQLADSTLLASVQPLKSYKLEAGKSSAYPYYDARLEIARYAALVHETYADAGEAAHELDDAVSALLDDPTEATLATARGAWLKARAAYMATEPYRFYGGPIDGAGDALARLDPWPIDETYVDRLIGDPKVDLTRRTLRQPPGAANAADAATGFHVIEFLLWGKDKNPGFGRGRPPKDYEGGSADRRRLYLTTAIKLLIEDIGQVTQAWAPQAAANYAAQLLALDQREALGRILSGMAILADEEIAHRRLLAALDDRTRASPLDRYSLHTNDDLTADLDGIRAVWTGDDRQSVGPGLDSLVAAFDPNLALRLDRRLAAAQAALRLLDKPFDRVLSAPRGSTGWTRVEEAAAAFHDLAVTIAEVGRLLAVHVPLSSSSA